MVGGIVVEVASYPERPDVLYVDCVDKSVNRKKADYCAILVSRDALSDKIQIGDAVWWHGKVAYWTPVQNIGGHLKGMKCHVDYDIQLIKVGGSGVQHPNRKPKSKSKPQS